MAEQCDRIGRSDAGWQMPRSRGWRVRAERAHGTRTLGTSRTLSASEIGAYTFCPHAWYLQRSHVPVTAETDARRRVGRRMHRAIGRRTDLVRLGGAVQRVLLITIGMMLLLLAALVIKGWA